VHTQVAKPNEGTSHHVEEGTSHNVNDVTAHYIDE